MNLYVQSVLTSLTTIIFIHLPVVLIISTGSVCRCTWGDSCKKASSPWDAVMISASRKSSLMIYRSCCNRMKLTNSIIWHLIRLWINKEIYHGVPVQIVNLHLCLKKVILSSNALTARSTTVSIAEYSFTKASHAKNTWYQISRMKMMLSSWNLWRERNLSSVHFASSGLRKLLGATIWGVNVARSFAMLVEEYT
jgi:hypothetical protein